MSSLNLERIKKNNFPIQIKL